MGCWIIASCQVVSNSVQRIQGRSGNATAKKSPGQPYWFINRHDKHKLSREVKHLIVELLLSVNVHQILFSISRRIDESPSVNQRQGRPYYFSDCQIPPHPQKQTNLVDNIEFLFPVKFWNIPLSGCTVNNGNVSANQTLRQQSFF